MNENKIVFKLNKHKKLWEVMPDYILKIVRESNGEGNMGGFVSLAKHRALVDLFPKEGYVVYDCFACQFTKNYEELYLDEVDENVASIALWTGKMEYSVDLEEIRFMFWST